MEDIIANIDDIRFDIEIALEEQLGLQPLPFPGMDKSGSAICDFYITNKCTRGQLCPLRHISGNQMVVCKHWLRGLCKKGDDCEFLHKYDMERMPECYFYIKYGQCSNKECPFLHLNPADKIKDCPWYDRGFCKHGPHCKNRHVRRTICVNYLCGFCPEGKKCKFSHPRFEVQMLEERKLFAHIVCHACGELGHKSTHCAVARRLAAEAAMRGEAPPEFSLTQTDSTTTAAVNTIQQINPHKPVLIRPPMQTVPQQQPPPQLQTQHQQAIQQAIQQQQQLQQQQQQLKTFPPPLAYPSGIPRDRDNPGDPGAPPPPQKMDTGNSAAFVPFGKRPLEFVTCFKCRGKGHYANRCPFTAVQRPPAGIPNNMNQIQKHRQQLQQQQHNIQQQQQQQQIQHQMEIQQVQQQQQQQQSQQHQQQQRPP